MKIMSINAGSSSLKFSLFNMDTEEVIASGLFERIGIENGHYVIKFNGEKIEQNIDLENHEAAVRILMDKLVDLDIISSLEDIDGIGKYITKYLIKPLAKFLGLATGEYTIEDGDTAIELSKEFEEELEKAGDVNED